MAVLDDQPHRHVGVGKDAEQARHCDRGECALHDRHRPHRAEQLVTERSVVAPQTERDQRELQRGERGGEPQRGEAGLGDHGFNVFVSCIAPAT